MAKSKRKSISGIDRKIASRRKAIAGIMKKKREKQSLSKKLSTLKKMDNKLKSLRKRVG